MLTLLRDIKVTRRCLVRCISEITSSSHDSTERDLLTINEDSINKKIGRRSLKVAILGAPNAGKSTLINQIVGRPVFCVSKKVHTTRKKARAAVVRDNVQILFVDTPGLVSQAAVKRHNLERSFVEDGLRAVNEANIVGVMHDSGNKWVRDRLDPKILDILHGMEDNKKAFLVLNKVDLIKKKDTLLETVRNLTNAVPSSEEEIVVQGEDGDVMKSKKNSEKIKPCGWPHFQEVFLVSALTGDGVEHILSYLVKEAKDGKWPLPPGRFTDQKSHKILEELIRGRLLDALPQEVPYNLIIETEYFHTNDLGEVVAVVLVTCPLERHRRMLIGGSGRLIKKVATLAEKDACVALNANVRMRVVVNAKENMERPKRSYGSRV